MYNVLIIEANPMERKLMELFVCSGSQYQLMSSSKDGTMAEELCITDSVDLILMDMVTAFNSGGLDLVGRLKNCFPEIKIILMTGFPEYSFIDRARQSGADSFWYKQPSAEELLRIMDITMAGGCEYPDDTPVISLGSASSADFTPREMEVLAEVVRGKTDAAIAESLMLSVSTVKFHIQKIREKTGFSTRTELAVRASEIGLVICQPNTKEI